jgi:hypothetical protein
MPWEVTLKESVIADLRWFGRKLGRLILNEALENSPRHETSKRFDRTRRPNVSFGCSTSIVYYSMWTQRRGW